MDMVSCRNLLIFSGPDIQNLVVLAACPRYRRRLPRQVKTAGR
jgi:hypothetical protein